MTTQDYGFSPLASSYWAATWVWAKWLDKAYNFDSITPIQAAEAVRDAADQKVLTTLTWTSRAVNAPRDVRGAWLKGAYLLARTSQYLQSAGLANLAKDYLERARSSEATQDTAAIARIYEQAGAAVKGVAGARAYSDGRIKMVLYYLGVQPGGAKSQGRPRDLPADIKSAQDRQMAPNAEADRSVQEAEEKIKAMAQRAYNLAKKAKDKRNKAIRQARMIKYGVGAGVLALVVVFVSSYVTKRN